MLGKLFMAGLVATYIFEWGPIGYTFFGFMLFVYYSEEATTTN